MLRGKLRENSILFSNIQRFIDPIILTNIFFLIFNQNQINFNFNYLIILFIDFFILNINNIYASYRFKNLYKLIPRIFYLSSSLLICNIIFIKNDQNFYSLELLILFISYFFYLAFHHILIRFLLRLLRIKGCNTRNIVFFGNKYSFRKVLIQILKNPWLGYKVVYWFSPNSNDHNKKTYINSNPFICKGGINDLKKIIENEEIDKLFFSYKNTDEIKFEKILKVVGNSCVSTSLIIENNIPLMSLKKENFGDIFALNLWNPEVSKFNETIKRIFDFSLGISFLLFLMPIFILISAIIKLSSEGPIIFYQYRYGLNGKVFKMYKFRTMFFDENLNKNEVIQAKKGDKRITSFGKFLRRYSLDEFPQLINVIKGEMSLVGPRPHASQHNEFYRKLITGYMQRHSKLPGMTGLAQIEGAKGETNTIEKMKRRIKFDMEYNNEWNLFKDFMILLKTIFVVIKGDSY